LAGCRRFAGRMGVALDAESFDLLDEVHELGVRGLQVDRTLP
jgi:hypothetical protein